MNVIVIGAGWAGLAAAVELVRHGHSVTVLESARQPGGRARAVAFNGMHIDNGQHILIGAYRSVLELIQLFGIEESRVFKRIALTLKLTRQPAGNRTISLKAWPLPAPLHLLLGLLTMKGAPWKHRLVIIKAMISMRGSGFKVEQDLPLLDYLVQLGQPQQVIEYLWQPLCISIMNTPIDQASTQMFLRVIRDSFFADKADSEMLLPVTDLGQCLPQPAMDYIEINGGTVRLGSRIVSIATDDNHVTGVCDTNNSTLQADHVVIATGNEAAQQLLRPILAAEPICSGLERLGALPITTVFIKYPAGTRLPNDFIGTLNMHSQWFFDRGRLTDNDGLIAVVISGPGQHIRMTNDELGKVIAGELSACFRHLPDVEAIKIIREKRATIHARPGVDQYRPDNSTKIDGLWLAGDYTNTGYPSTLEGAVRSGLRCARLIMESSQA
ncbi:MAG: hydroxysqualene dehydroxylase HpnE [Gammaproteobacteria bacterium]|nr:hydroxysqualene dehydroxylase HpnE [Gammaproteobacteria bacterium]